MVTEDSYNVTLTINTKPKLFEETELSCKQKHLHLDRLGVGGCGRSKIYKGLSRKQTNEEYIQETEPNTA